MEIKRRDGLVGYKVMYILCRLENGKRLMVNEITEMIHGKDYTVSQRASIAQIIKRLSDSNMIDSVRVRCSFESPLPTYAHAWGIIDENILKENLINLQQ